MLLDPQQRILLFASRMPDGADTRLWAAPGGAVEPGETWEQAARRELHEETGLDLAMGPCIWHRDHTWSRQSDARSYRSIEHYFVAHTVVTAIDQSGWTPLERDTLIAHHWWTVDELAASRDVIAPRKLALLLPPILTGELTETPLVLTE